MNLPQKKILALCQIAAKTFPTLCQKCLLKLFQHFAKTDSKGYDDTLPNCLYLNIAGIFENYQQILFPTRLNATLIILPLNGFTGSLVVFSGTLKCRQSGYLV
jgi:hypothetical protein